MNLEPSTNGQEIASLGFRLTPKRLQQRFTTQFDQLSKMQAK